MKRLLIHALLPLFAAGSFSLAAASTAAAEPAPSSTIATATYTLTYTCAAGPGCVVGTAYVHTYTLTIDCNLAITGTGTQADAPQVLESVTGTLGFDPSTRSTTVNIVSTYVSDFMTGYTIATTGTLNPFTGQLTGTAVAGLAGDPGTAATFSVSGVRTSVVFNPNVSCSNGDEDEDEGDDLQGDDD
jgi:hypothetical protein